MDSLLNIWSDHDRKIFSTIFLLWMITLPFGSYIIGFNVGFFTVYPAFLFLIVLFVRFFVSINSWHIGLRSFSFFLFLWLIYGICSRFWIDNIGVEDWKFDVKSLLMQFLTLTMLFGAFHFFGRTLFERLFTRGLVVFMIVLVISGLYEYYTGNHILGKFTDKMLLEKEVQPYFYSPSFVYDNPNDYLVYYNGILTLLVYQLRNSRQYAWLLLSVAVLGLLFAVTAQAFLMIIADLFLISWLLLRTFIAYYEYFKSFTFWTIPVAILLLAILFARSNQFYGPKYVKGNYTTEGLYELFPTPGEYFTSIDIRKNLLNNGLDFIAEKPLTGIGAGQFRYRHASDQVKYETGTVNGPHNFIIEIVAQYGIVAWLFILFLFVGFAGTFSRFWQSKRNYYSLLLLFLLYPLFSIVPSGFLYMDLNRLMIAALIIYSFALPFEKSE